MDRSLFKEPFPGRLEKIAVNGEADWAFIPSPLPIEWRVSENVLSLLTTAHRVIGELNGVGTHMPNHELLLKPLQRREALRSSSLEGTYATPEQLLLFEMTPKEPRSANDPANDWKEVANYGEALRLGQLLLKDMPLSLRLIREIHQKLLTGVRGRNKAPGEFRRTQVHIGSNRRFIPPPPLDARKCMESLELQIHEESTIEPLIFCFMVHYQFEAIHPFLDGNGRVGRLLLSLMIYECLELYRPWLYLSAFFEKHKQGYIDNLFNVSARGDWESWVAYCLRGTVEQGRDAIRRLKALIGLQKKYHEMIHGRGGSARWIQIVDYLMETQVITVPEIARKFQVTTQTARNDVRLFVREGILLETDVSKKPLIFVAPEIVKAAYLDLPEEPDLSNAGGSL